TGWEINVLHCSSFLICPRRICRTFLASGELDLKSSSVGQTSGMIIPLDVRYGIWDNRGSSRCNVCFFTKIVLVNCY
ncbi:unnamed protein product, partial [Ilex paraguariensis]